MQNREVTSTCAFPKKKKQKQKQKKDFLHSRLRQHAALPRGPNREFLRGTWETVKFESRC